jgi:hypothetical protein
VQRHQIPLGTLHSHRGQHLIRPELPGVCMQASSLKIRAILRVSRSTTRPARASPRPTVKPWAGDGGHDAAAFIFRATLVRLTRMSASNPEPPLGHLSSGGAKKFGNLSRAREPADFPKVPASLQRRTKQCTTGRTDWAYRDRTSIICRVTLSVTLRLALRLASSKDLSGNHSALEPFSNGA